jgi:hypothetical protein
MHKQLLGSLLLLLGGCMLGPDYETGTRARRTPA